MTHPKTLRQMDDDELKELIDTAESPSILNKAAEELKRRRTFDRRSEEDEEDEDETIL